MKRKLLTALVGALAVATALPAFAMDFKVNGFLRTRFIADNYSNGASPVTVFEENPNNEGFIEQRFRAKLTLGVNEYLSCVYFGELDLFYGDASFVVARNQGGAIQADSVNLETKNIYMDIKIPETAVSGRIGVQGMADNWSGYFILSDVAGIMANYSFNQGTVTGLYAKLWEGDKTAGDDVDLWGLMFGMKPMGDFKFGVDFFYANDNDATNPANLPGSQGLYGRADLYWIGANAKYDLKGSFPVSFSGWAFYNGGKLKDVNLDTLTGSTGLGTDDVDVKGWAADLSAKFKLGPAGLGLEGFYVSGDTGDDEIKMPLSTGLWSGTSFNLAGNNLSTKYGAAGPDMPFYSSGLMILMYDPYAATDSQAAFRDPQNGTLGCWGLVLTGNYSPETMKALYMKGTLGYINSVEDARKAYSGDGKTNLGTEVNARVGYVIASNFDLSLNAAYVFLGDFYDGWDSGQDPDDPYIVYAMAALNF